MVAFCRDYHSGQIQGPAPTATSKDFGDEIPPDLGFVLEVVGVQGEVVLLGPGSERIEEDEDHHVDQGDFPEKEGGKAPERELRGIGGVPAVAVGTPGDDAPVGEIGGFRAEGDCSPAVGCP